MKQSSGLKSKMESGDNAMISSIRFLYRRTEKAESDDRFAGSRVFAAILREELESHIVPEWFAIEAELAALKVENERLREAASDLFDNRLGWSDGRQPYAPRHIWQKLGTVLYGADDPRVTELSVCPECLGSSLGEPAMGRVHHATAQGKGNEIMLKCKSCGVDHKDGYDYGLPCVECIMSTQQARIAELEAKLLDSEQVIDAQSKAVMKLGATLGRVKASVERFCCIPHRKTKPHACTPMDVSDVESLRSLLSGVPEVLAVVECKNTGDVSLFVGGGNSFTGKEIPAGATVIVLAKHGTQRPGNGDNETEGAD